MELKSFFVEQDVNVQRKVFTVPNAITFVGVLAVVAYIFMYSMNIATAFIPVMVIFVGLSDVLDGLAARKLDSHTYLGKILDPLRDRFLGLALILNIALYAEGALVYLFTAAIVVAELLTGYINWQKERKNKTGGSVHTAGKLRMLVHGLCGGAFVVQTYWPSLQIWPLPLNPIKFLAIMLIASIIATVFYLFSDN
ncbi:MAG: CDP-alcohol phosphatidyltransferase family protein [Candidatus Spechtbacterales bacterium]|nr:CDP-alcohol phosphatidyltransferase family protein [Candidatus Spechtbacterales bacterium]